MGCEIFCSLWETFATFMQWLVRFKSKYDSLFHYLDDFICLGQSQSGGCKATLSSFIDTCNEMNIPLVDIKTVNPTPILVFLGLELNSILIHIRIPVDKLKKRRLHLGSCNPS